MEKWSLKRKSLLLSFFLVSFISSAQSTMSELRGQLDAQKTDFFGVVDIIIICCLFGGLIYVITQLVMKSPNARGALIGWIGAVMLWGLAKVILSIS